MAPLAFLLQCAALAALAGTAAALLGLGLLPVVAHARPGVRADVAAALGSLPALTALALVGAVASPSVASALGLAADHCPSHGHHAHLCLVHFDGLHPKLAVLGALALAVFLYRAAALVGRGLTARVHLAGLERLGSRRAGEFPIVLLPGAPQLCHAAGIRHPRVLLSASLAGALGGAELRGALAHESAHLRRRDPLLRLVLSVAGLFAPPPLARAALRAYQAAAEEACDACAARAVGDGAVVAGALVKVAALQRDTALAHAAPAFGTTDLERRVDLLLRRAETHETGRSRALLLLGLLAVPGLCAVLAHGETIHHAVETALHHLL